MAQVSDLKVSTGVGVGQASQSKQTNQNNQPKEDEEGGDLAQNTREAQGEMDSGDVLAYSGEISGESAVAAA